MRKSIFISAPLTLSTALLGCTPKEQPLKPNVAIIFIDDMGYGDLSCYGNTVVKTPNMDALAQKGVRFTNFYVNSPICSPSRVALNTGTYPMRHKIHSYIAGSKQNHNRAMADYLDPQVQTLARTLQRKQYRTGHFGKWHMGGGRDLGNVPYPTEYGFDKSLVSFEGIGDRVLFPGDGLSQESAKLGKGEIIWTPKHKSTSIYVDSALTFINKCGDTPFYINLCPNDVHDPHLPDSVNLEKWKNVTDNPWEQKFFAVLEELDKQIGRFIDGLDEMGKLDNTIILFASDNGPTDWPHYYKPASYPDDYRGELYPPGFTGSFYGRKWSLYEGGIREPFFVYWKGHFPEGKVDDQTIVSAIDIFPTICSLLEIPTPEKLDGTDKSTAFFGNPIEKVPPVMWEYSSNPGGSIKPGNKDFISPNLAIRDGEWKLLINADSTNIQLFNLKNDPGETLNLEEQNEEIVKKLSEKVINWRKAMPVEIPR
ncbi:sulfatase family protein [Gaoshiqia sediminis]|uniref:Sulfatase-like hydrolase/transferase n=1 Tax=Gaoshiqia sediminis TaxID=2986998 RepID=A0AA41Y6C9_9BACT|nr:sulfatase-like hydrolase/transferase [Gaoshiqia sediminis]MCW0484244.1 sulfatase-like hydrolase/transferase [Gaoshiqia sediminis]